VARMIPWRVIEVFVRSMSVLDCVTQDAVIRLSHAP
jgi:hypothetical protein